jgi:uncharacterized membrane protein
VAYLRLKIVHIMTGIPKNTRSCFITCTKSFLWVIISIITQKEVMNKHTTQTTLYMVLHFDSNFILNEIPPNRKIDIDILKRCCLNCLSHDISLFILLLLYTIRNNFTYKLQKMQYYWHTFVAQINTLVLRAVYPRWQWRLRECCRSHGT